LKKNQRWNQKNCFWNYNEGTQGYDPNIKITS
jgi:hypothetical protein